MGLADTAWFGAELAAYVALTAWAWTRRWAGPVARVALAVLVLAVAGAAWGAVAAPNPAMSLPTWAVTAFRVGWFLLAATAAARAAGTRCAIRDSNPEPAG